MSSIIFITTKTDANVPWITKSNTDFTYISETDYQSNVAPYWNYVKSLPGFQSIKSTSTDTISIVMVNFDTSEHANSASVQLLDSTNTIIKNKNNSYALAMEKVGVANNYTSYLRII